VRTVAINVWNRLDAHLRKHAPLAEGEHVAAEAPDAIPDGRGAADPVARS